MMVRGHFPVCSDDAIATFYNAALVFFQMFVGSSSKVYILDKVEGNPTTAPSGDHPAYAVEW